MPIYELEALDNDYPRGWYRVSGARMYISDKHCTLFSRIMFIFMVKVFLSFNRRQLCMSFEWPSSFYYCVKLNIWLWPYGPSPQVPLLASNIPPDSIFIFEFLSLGFT